jgi:hypothetical protein
MSEESRVPRIAGIAVAVAVIVAIVVVVLVRRGGSPGDQPPVETPPASPATPAAAPTPSLAERLSARLQGVTLRTSDAAVRELVGEMAGQPQLATWLASEDLVRRFVASVQLVANGSSPRSRLGFMVPADRFQVVRRGGAVWIDPGSYRRYDPIVAVVTAVDAADAVALYRELEPLLDEAYLEIAPPGSDFTATLVKAIDNLLATPIPSGEVEVEEKVVTYSFADARLEGLSGAQRQLLRMGPDNARRVQAALRVFKEELQRTAGEPA